MLGPASKDSFYPLLRFELGRKHKKECIADFDLVVVVYTSSSDEVKPTLLKKCLRALKERTTGLLLSTSELDESFKVQEAVESFGDLLGGMLRLRNRPGDTY